LKVRASFRLCKFYSFCKYC